MTEENTQANETMLERMKNRDHSYREWEPRDFHTAIEEGERMVPLQGQLRRIEDGRFYDMLDRTHLMFIRLDEDERNMWAERNPNMMKWLEVFGIVDETTKVGEYIP
jgi:hypothetical protein